MKKVKIESILANSKVRKGIEIISSIPFFVEIFTVFFFFKISSLHSIFMTENIEDVVKYSEKIFVIGKMFAKNPDKIASFRWVLLLETILVSIILSISLYQSLLLTLHTTKVVGFLFRRPLHCCKSFSFTRSPQA